MAALGEGAHLLHAMARRGIDIRQRTRGFGRPRLDGLGTRSRPAAAGYYCTMPEIAQAPGWVRVCGGRSPSTQRRRARPYSAGAVPVT